MRTDSGFILEIPNDLRIIPRAVELVVRRCQTCEAQAAKFRFNFRVALTEALSNAMLYGNASDPTKRVQLDVQLFQGRVVACVRDQGNGFDPEAVEDPTLPENLTRPGGRGLFLMRKLLDEVRYNARGNAVTLVMYLESESTFDEAASA